LTQLIVDLQFDAALLRMPNLGGAGNSAARKAFAAACDGQGWQRWRGDWALAVGSSVFS
jgi:hypothetical protein